MSINTYAPMPFEPDPHDSPPARADDSSAALRRLRAQIEAQDAALAAARNCAERIGGDVEFLVQRADLSAIEEAASERVPLGMGSHPNILLMNRA